MTTTMTAITTEQIRDLREKTGAGMMDAKKALTDAQGDMEKAMELLRQKGIASAEKKLGRAAAEGLVETRISADQKTGLLVEINCETDFVARGEAFQALVKTIADKALASSVTSAEALLAQTLESGKTIDEYVKENVGTIKENLGVRRLVRYAVSGAGAVFSYIHTGGKIGVLLQLNVSNDSLLSQDAFKALAKDLTLHIASTAPDYLNKSEIPAEDIAREKEIEMGKEDLQSKPAEIREKIVSGRLDKLFAARVFLEQPFVKDPNQTVAQLVESTAKTLGGEITVAAFTRYLLGEGIEKKQENFADEVMAQIKA